MSKKINENKSEFGLIGRNIAYSFSVNYFSNKFKIENIENTSYLNFDWKDITEFQNLKNKKNLKGCNVTIPYKQEIIPYLDAIDPVAEKIGAVNTIKNENGKWIGYNTDAHGFQKALEPLLNPNRKKALILGTGGASKAVAYVLDLLNIEYQFVSRKGKLTYENITEEIIHEHLLIVNCTPLGTFPNINEKPKLPYKAISENHLLFDLIYNPEITAFLKEGILRNATSKNGYEMLVNQAEKSWDIWN